MAVVPMRLTGPAGGPTDLQCFVVAPVQCGIRRSDVLAYYIRYYRVPS
jgi:hypothetical protein